VTLYKIWSNSVKLVSIEIGPSWFWTNFGSIQLSSPRPKFDCIGLRHLDKIWPYLAKTTATKI